MKTKIPTVPIWPTQSLKLLSHCLNRQKSHRKEERHQNHDARTADPTSLRSLFADCRSFA